MSSNDLPKTAVAEQLAQKICALDAARLPKAVRVKCEELLIDGVGLAVTARNEDYVKSALAASDDDGPCTVIGHARTHSAACAALVNGTAIHGEDFDDTFEGGPVHTGAVIVPAVLAACERQNRDGRAALLGIAVGVETMCRLSSGRADAHPQSRIPPDRGIRRRGRDRRRWRRTRNSPRAKWSTRSAPSARWPAASSNISPRAPGPSGCTPAGRRNRACARRCSAVPVFPGRAPCSKACTVSFTVLRTRPRATTRR